MLHGVLAQEGGPIDAVFGSFETNALWVILVISLVALVFAYYLVREVLAAPEGSPKMREIATAIQVGAKAYLAASSAPWPCSWRSSRSCCSSRCRSPRTRPQRVRAPVRPLARLPPRRRVQRDHRVRGHVAGRPRTCAPRTPPRSPACEGAADRVPRRRGGGDVHGRARPVRGHRDPADLRAGRDGRAGGVRVRRGAPRDVHAGRRRHLHQGRGRGRRPRRQGRGGIPEDDPRNAA